LRVRGVCRAADALRIKRGSGTMGKLSGAKVVVIGGAGSPKTAR
jgi:hypothetical protein